MVREFLLTQETPATQPPGPFSTFFGRQEGTTNGCQDWVGPRAGGVAKRKQQKNSGFMHSIEDVCHTRKFEITEFGPCVEKPLKFNSSPLKMGRNPKGKDRLPTIIFQRRTVKLRRGIPFISSGLERVLGHMFCVRLLIIDSGSSWIVVLETLMLGIYNWPTWYIYLYSLYSKMKIYNVISWYHAYNICFIYTYCKKHCLATCSIINLQGRLMSSIRPKVVMCWILRRKWRFKNDPTGSQKSSFNHPFAGAILISVSTVRMGILKRMCWWSALLSQIYKQRFVSGIHTHTLSYSSIESGG